MDIIPFYGHEIPVYGHICAVYGPFNPDAMNRFLFKIVLCSFLFSRPGAASLLAQTISNGDGAPLTTQYCWEDMNFPILGQPSGGSFDGCGVFEQNGQWLFNPVIATQGLSVFPVQCFLSYTINGTTVTIPILIWKPVVIDPPLEDSFTCNGNFLLHAKTLYAGAYDYSWTPATYLEQPDSANTAGYIDASQTFVLTATDHTSGCMGSDTVIINRYLVPVLSINPDTAILPYASVQLVASGAAQYQWEPERWLNNPAIAGPLATPEATVTYTVTGTSADGCSATAEVHIRLIEDFLIPNAFSPNGDGLNDEFKIINFGYLKLGELRIFDRWGQQVFYTKESGKGWDGRIKGEPADTGAYQYYLRMWLSDGTPKVFKGDILLIY